jgi:hypothetical protein
MCFWVKLLHILKHTNEHPGDHPKLGTTWAMDGRSLFAYSKIVEDFLRIRTNSINTNFRDHGFEIFANGRYTDPKLANLPECSRWKRRRHPELTQAPSDFWLFGHVKTLPVCQTFDEPEQLPEAIAEFLNGVRPPEVVAIFSHWVERVRWILENNRDYYHE